MSGEFRGKHPKYLWVKKPSSAPRLLEYERSNDGWQCYDLASITKALERILGDKRLIADAKIKAMDELVSTDWTQLKIAGVNPMLLVVVEWVVESTIGVRARVKVGDQARDQVWTQIGDQVGGQVGEQVWAQFGNQVWAQSRSQTDVQLESQIQTAVKEYLGGQSSSTAENILRPIIHYASLVYKLQYVAKLNEPSFANKLKQLCSDNNIIMDSYAGFVPEFKVFLTEMLKQTNEPLIQRQIGTLLNHLSGQALESN